MVCRSGPFMSGVALAAGVVVLPSVGGVLAQERDRAKIADKYKWNLAEIYPSDDAWRHAKNQLVGDIPEMQNFQGPLASSPARLADALERLTQPEQGPGARLRLRQHAVGRGHPGQQYTRACSRR